MVSRMVVAAALLASVGCNGDPCTSGDTRCQGDTVQVCDAEGRWAEVANCLNVTASDQPNWRCCVVEVSADAGAVHACLPGRECAEADR